jgi:hypothetical protein
MMVQNAILGQSCCCDSSSKSSVCDIVRGTALTCALHTLLPVASHATSIRGRPAVNSCSWSQLQLIAFAVDRSCSWPQLQLVAVAVGRIPAGDSGQLASAICLWECTTASQTRVLFYSARYSSMAALNKSTSKLGYPSIVIR